MGRSTLISLNTTQAHIQTPSRMNKLLMLAFLVTLMGLMATAAPQEEVDELELDDMAEEESMEEVGESREAREAGRKKKCRGGKCRDRKQRLSRQRSGKKGSMKGGKTRPARPAKKSKKSQKSKKPKKNDNGKAERKGSINGARAGCSRASTDYTCLINAMTYLKMACATENMPLPNMTEVSACVSTMETFKGMVANCQKMKENGTEACTCWSNSNFTSLAATIRKCKINKDQAAVIDQLKYCRGNFSACKTAEDDGMKAMSSCATSKSALLASAKALTANS